MRCNEAEYLLDATKRFYSVVRKTSTCWFFDGCCDKKQYGRFSFKRKAVFAHRFSWMLTHGKMPPSDQCICHHCDNPRCVNPDHLFIGTIADNNHDMHKKGRYKIVLPGERHHNVKLSEVKVVEIRHKYATGKRKFELAKEYGVHFVTIHDIVERRTWVHI